MGTPVKPYKDSEEGKKSQIKRMFDKIAGRYDMMNHLLAFGIDVAWRHRLLRSARRRSPQFILDVATGTGDLAVMLAGLNPVKVVGIDLSEGMLEVARGKVRRKGLGEVVELMCADCENLPFESASFDMVTVSFGVRNFENLTRGLKEMLRVLRPGGTLLILEFSKPSGCVMKELYSLYSKNVMPLASRLLSKDKKAYDYLPESIEAFPCGETFCTILRQAGFISTKHRKLSFGIATLYKASKAVNH